MHLHQAVLQINSKGEENLNANLDIIKIACIARCIKPAHIFQHIAPALRGAFGFTLVRLFEKNDGKPSLYKIIFKNETENTYSDKYVTGKPNPYVFEAPMQMRTELKRGDTFAFSITLFGIACGYVPEVIFTIEQMLKGNIMNNERSFELYSASNSFTREAIYNDGAVCCDIGLIAKPWNWTNEVASDVRAGSIRIKFLEPVSIKENGKPASAISFLLLIRAVLNRLRLLTYVYGGDFQIERNSLEKYAALIKTGNSNLHITSFVTFSRTQMQKKTYHGLIGDITYDGDLTLFLPYVNIGSVLHIGRNTVMGMGQYAWSIEY